MKITVCAAAAALFVAATGTASAEGFAVSDLGIVADKSTCVSMAEKAFETYRQVNGGGYHVTDDWVVYQYDIGPQASDAFIACIDFGERSLGFLTVFSEREATGDVRDKVRDFFQGQK